MGSSTRTSTAIITGSKKHSRDKSNRRPREHQGDMAKMDAFKEPRPHSAQAHPFTRQDVRRFWGTAASICTTSVKGHTTGRTQIFDPCAAGAATGTVRAWTRHLDSQATAAAVLNLRDARQGPCDAKIQGRRPSHFGHSPVTTPPPKDLRRSALRTEWVRRCSRPRLQEAASTMRLRRSTDGQIPRYKNERSKAAITAVYAE